MAEVHTLTLYRWGDVVERRAVGSSRSDAVTAACAMLFTTVLITCFVPVGVLIGDRYAVLLQSAAADSGKSEFSIEVWKARMGLGDPPLSQVQSYVALVAPLIAGVAGAFFNSNSGHSKES
jgi:hypothetical protein